MVCLDYFFGNILSFATLPSGGNVEYNPFKSLFTSHVVTLDSRRNGDSEINDVKQMQLDCEDKVQSGL